MELPPAPLLLVNLDHFSIENLLRVAFHADLISDYAMTPTCIRLFRKGEILMTGDPEEIRFYLRGLLKGLHTEAALP